MFLSPKFFISNCEMNRKLLVSILYTMQCNTMQCNAMIHTSLPVLLDMYDFLKYLIGYILCLICFWCPQRLKEQAVTHLPYMFRLPFAAGQVFSSAMLDRLLYQAILFVMFVVILSFSFESQSSLNMFLSVLQWSEHTKE